MTTFDFKHVVLHELEVDALCWLCQRHSRQHVSRVQRWIAPYYGHAPGTPQIIVPLLHCPYCSPDFDPDRIVIVGRDAKLVGTFSTQIRTA